MQAKADQCVSEGFFPLLGQLATPPVQAEGAPPTGLPDVTLTVVGVGCLQVGVQA